MNKCIKCGSYAFNLYKDGIDQGGFCDVHYWQGRAHRAEASEQPVIAWAVMKDGKCLSVRRFEPVASGEAEGVEFVPLVRFAKQPAQYRSTGWAAHRDQYAVPVLFSPYTGEPRDVRDVQSDPQGILIVPPGKVEMRAAKQTHHTEQHLEMVQPAQRTWVEVEQVKWEGNKLIAKLKEKNT